jgi:hypothetical protein
VCICSFGRAKVLFTPRTSTAGASGTTVGTILG